MFLSFFLILTPSLPLKIAIATQYDILTPSKLLFVTKLSTFKNCMIFVFFNKFFIRRYLLLLQCFYYYMLFHCLSGTSTYLYPLLYLSNHFYSTQIMYIHINYQLFKIIKLIFANNLFKFFLISFNKQFFSLSPSKR